MFAHWLLVLRESHVRRFGPCSGMNSNPCLVGKGPKRRAGLAISGREERGFAMTKLPLEVGNSCTFTKTVSESDVYMFGGITGDYSQMHFNEAFMKTTKYGTRIVHGVLTFAFGSTASTLIQQKYESPIPSASYGYDHLRFTAPVYFGDTLTATYTVKEVDEEAMKTYADVVITNQDGTVVCVATHILKFFEVEE